MDEYILINVTRQPEGSGTTKELADRLLTLMETCGLEGKAKAFPTLASIMDNFEWMPCQRGHILTTDF